MEKELSIQELSNQMIDNCVAWKNLKKRLCKEIKNCLLPNSVSPIDECLDVTVIDMRPVQDGKGQELVLGVTLLDRIEKIPFLHLAQLNQMFYDGLTDIELQSTEGIMAHRPNYNLAFTLSLRSAEDDVEESDDNAPENKEQSDHQPVTE